MFQNCAKPRINIKVLLSWLSTPQNQAVVILFMVAVQQLRYLFNSAKGLGFKSHQRCLWILFQKDLKSIRCAVVILNHPAKSKAKSYCTLCNTVSLSFDRSATVSTSQSKATTLSHKEHNPIVLCFICCDLSLCIYYCQILCVLFLNPRRILHHKARGGSLRTQS